MKNSLSSVFQRKNLLYPSTIFLSTILGGLAIDSLGPNKKEAISDFQLGVARVTSDVLKNPGDSFKNYRLFSPEYSSDINVNQEQAENIKKLYKECPEKVVVIIESSLILSDLPKFKDATCGEV